MRTIELNSTRRSYSVIEVLAFLKGRKIDKVVMGYLHALRPSKIEVVPFRESTHCDAFTWRVRIFLNKDETIDCIQQEIQVGCYDDVEHGAHLSCLLNTTQ